MPSRGDAPRRISVFGLGKLGSVVAACWASRGFEVIGVDPNREFVDKINQGVAPVQEPHLDRMIAEAGERLRATTDGREAVLATDITFMVVPTPSNPDGGYAIDYVLSCCDVIGPALAEKGPGHLVTLKSTVLPGACADRIIPRLEETSGRRAGEHFGFCYNPEFIALGSVVQNLLEPSFLLIGESHPEAGEMLVEAHSRMLGNDTPMPRMSCANAELAKLAVNSLLTMKITFANLIAQLCEQLPDGDSDVVTSAVGLDPRIGNKYLKGGLGFGGPCFPRDNSAVLHLARKLGVPFPLAAATDQANAALTVRIAEQVEESLPRDGKVAVLGLSYKPDTPVVEESQGLALAATLAKRGYRVSVYDPMALETARPELGDSVRYAEQLRECVADADVVAVATPWKEFRDLPLEAMNAAGPRIVHDCWGIVDGSSHPGVKIRVLGVGESSVGESSGVYR